MERVSSPRFRRGLGEAMAVFAAEAEGEAVKAEAEAEGEAVDVDVALVAGMVLGGIDEANCTAFLAECVRYLIASSGFGGTPQPWRRARPYKTWARALFAPWGSARRWNIWVEVVRSPRSWRRMACWMSSCNLLTYCFSSEGQRGGGRVWIMDMEREEGWGLTSDLSSGNLVWNSVVVVMPGVRLPACEEVLGVRSGQSESSTWWPSVFRVFLVGLKSNDLLPPLDGIGAGLGGRITGCVVPCTSNVARFSH